MTIIQITMKYETIKYFKLYELVSEQVYRKYGETAWQFFDPRLLKTIVWIRKKLNKIITINTWYWNGEFNERGLRANLDSIVKNATDSNRLYLSPHIQGAAIDFDVKGMKAEEVRQWLIENKSDLPYSIRLEKDVNWVHLDVRETKEKIYIF